MNYVILVKENDRKIFFLFDDGSARDMTHGLGNIINDFHEFYNNMIKDGYEEEPVMVRYKF